MRLKEKGILLILSGLLRHFAGISCKGILENNGKQTNKQLIISSCSSLPVIVYTPNTKYFSEFSHRFIVCNILNTKKF
jgi:hypothetical protein